MNMNRHSKGAVVAGQSAGGQFAGSLKTAADGQALAAAPRRVSPPELTAVEVAEKRMHAIGQQIYRARLAENNAMVDYVAASAKEIHPDAEILVVIENDEWDGCLTTYDGPNGPIVLDINGETLDLSSDQQDEFCDLLHNVNLDSKMTRNVSPHHDAQPRGSSYPSEKYELALVPSTPHGPTLMSAVGSDLNPDWVEVEARADDGTEATYLVRRDEYVTSAAAPFAVDPARHPTIARAEETDEH